ncbi:GNAT family N-acetyltransferase [Chlorogloeopsis sp. ULAP01]|uniref:GNAT family N-acetyltransferase n=1 Tax=Chlorogloeopsis TaxID=1123 RepID=UPI0019E02585|nr:MULTISPECIES: GNAT family N-acetyltransferase [Chlorogloeopsis]MBF2007787.1 GNAT family N-acetyltransferase [Chlorogloeopsis fritschii C42_A2020_084]MDM9383177.1 GNAT family N-acetyltransferase [Chlorogloeopsis sp. ULAP01]
MEINLREINQDNWKECIRLKTTEEQEKFVASNLYSLAESKFYPSSVAFGIYHNETIIGFIMYDRMDSGYQNSGYFIWRFMIDKNHQGKGYGKAAMQAVIKLLQQKPDCKEILIGYKPENIVAEKLYLSLGFQKTGLIEHGDVLVYLPLEPSKDMIAK